MRLYGTAQNNSLVDSSSLRQIGISKHMERANNQLSEARKERRRSQNRRNVARYRERRGDVHRVRWAAYMRDYRARKKLLRQNKEDNNNDNRNDRCRSRQRKDDGNRQNGN